jgi:uncharacterized membrane protein
MAIGRLGGDQLAGRLGLRLVAAGAAVAAAALLAALLAGDITITLLALAVCGLGIAWAFPAAISAADPHGWHAWHHPRLGAAYGAGLAGPPLLGFAAQQTGLNLALGLVVAAAAAVALLASRLQKRIAPPDPSHRCRCAVSATTAAQPFTDWRPAGAGTLVVLRMTSTVGCSIGRKDSGMFDDSDRATRSADGGRATLRGDCERCVGLCCVASPFAASADFAIDKPAGAVCPNLEADFRCGIHARLRAEGFPGCTAYDCFGAGQ